MGIAEAANGLGCSQEMVRKYILEGKLQAERVGKGLKKQRYRLSPSDVAAFALANPNSKCKSRKKLNAMFGTRAPEAKKQWNPYLQEYSNV